MTSFILHIFGSIGIAAAVIERLQAGQNSNAIYDRFFEHERLVEYSTHYAPNVEDETALEHYERMVERKFRLMDLAENL